VDFLFGLAVVSALLMGFVYISSSAHVGNNALASVEHFLRSVLVGVLGLSYFILSFMGKLSIFFLGIVLPVQSMFVLFLVLCKLIGCF